MESVIKIKLVPVRHLYSSEDFQVYACTTSETDKVKIDEKYNTFVINGEMPVLQLYQEYDAELVKTFYKGRVSYEAKVHIPIPMTVEDKHNFLRAILPPSQAEGIIEAYPNEDIIQLFKEDKIDVNKVRGLGLITYPKARERVLKNLEYYEALGKLTKYGLKYGAIRKIVDKYGSSALAIEKIESNPYVLTEIEGYGFIKVDKIALKSGIREDDPHRIISAGVYILSESGNEGHCWLYEDDFYDKLNDLLRIDEGTIKKVAQEDSRLFFLNGTVGLNHIYEREVRIGNKIYELLKVNKNYRIKDIENKIKEVEAEQGFEFTEEQRDGIYKVIENNLVIITGKAGTGKTSLLKGILKILNGYSYLACSLSGKAAQRIEESTGYSASTIHRALGYNPQYGFAFNEENPLPFDVAVLDEGSMVDNYLFDKLISAIEKGKKFLILGDIEQLPPIGAGNVMRDLIESEKVPIVELTEVHRQALKSGILLAANHVREGRQLMKRGEIKPKIVGELKDLQLIPQMTDEDILRSILKSAQKAKMSGIGAMDFQVIVPTKDRGLISTKNLNIELQKIFNPDEGLYIQRGDFQFKRKDKIIKNGNDYDNKVYNGTMGTVDYVGEDFIEVVFENGVRVHYEKDNLDQIDMAYALSIHRCQGSQFPYVVIGLDYSAYKLLCRQLVYTALTRASKGCKMIFEPKALAHAIRTDGSKRNTYLKDQLVV